MSREGRAEGKRQTYAPKRLKENTLTKGKARERIETKLRQR